MREARLDDALAITEFLVGLGLAMPEGDEARKNHWAALWRDNPALKVHGSGAALGEERSDQLTAFSFEHPTDHLHVVVQRRGVEHLHRRPHRPGLRLRRAVDQAADASMHDRAGAHQARLETDDQSAPGEVP